MPYAQRSNQRYTTYARRNYPKRYSTRYPRTTMVRAAPKLKVNSGPYATRFFILKTSFNVSTSGAGVLATTVNNDPTSYPDFTSVANLFETYRVAGLKIHWIPHNINNSGNYEPIYVINSTDPSYVPSSIPQQVAFPNLKVFNPQVQFKYYCKCPKATSTIDTATQVLQGGYIETISPQPTHLISLYGEDLPASTNLGSLIVTQYLSARSRA